MNPPANWVKRHIDQIKPGGRVIDIAAGQGRHSLLALQLGYHVTAVDRNSETLAVLEHTAAEFSSNLTTRTVDLETSDWPLTGEVYDGVIVSNYLYRPHFRDLLGLVAPGGMLIYETFALGNERFGRPSNPDFLLAPNELLTAVLPDFTVLGFEDITTSPPAAACKQRVAARRPG